METNFVNNKELGMQENGLQIKFEDRMELDYLLRLAEKLAVYEGEFSKKNGSACDIKDFLDILEKNFTCEGNGTCYSFIPMDKIGDLYWALYNSIGFFDFLCSDYLETKQLLIESIETNKESIDLCHRQDEIIKQMKETIERLTTATAGFSK